MKTVVLGLGNPILTDDSVGLKVARAVQERVVDPDVSVIEACTGGLEVLDLLLELQTYIRQLLAKFSDDNFDKKDILSRLPSMPYREQTFLVRKLKELEG